LRELESLEFEPELESERPLLLQLLVDLQEQLVLALELQVAELQRLGQERRLKPLGFEAALVPALELQVVELLRQEQDLRLKPLGVEPALELELLPLVALRLRELELLGFEPALELEPPLFLRLLVDLQEQLELVELLRQG
jgi:hypothetical protein